MLMLTFRSSLHHVVTITRRALLTAALGTALAAPGPVSAQPAPLTTSSATPSSAKPSAKPVQAARHAADIAQARAVVVELMKAKQIPGLSIAVVSRGVIVWSEGFGLADVEQDVAVSPQTKFRVGSVSKMLTVGAVARLVESGQLDLDAPVQRYVPAFPAKPWPITTRQLTGHLAGIRHYGPNDNRFLDGAPHFESVTKSLTIFQDDPLNAEPGTAYAYSSYGWNLVAAVVEGASKEEFLRYMQNAVFDPLELRNTTADQNAAITSHRTRFYVRDAGGALRNAPYVDNSYKWAGGGFLSTADDLARYASAYLRPGFLRQDTLDLLFTSQKLRSGKETGVGIGWRIGADAKGRRIYHHGGSIEGGRAMLMIFPQSQLVVAITANLLANFGEPDAMRIGDLFIH